MEVKRQELEKQGITFEDIQPSEAAQYYNKNFSKDDLQAKGVTFTALDAPNNSVFDQDNDRVVSLPQTLNATETGYLIKRDADQIKTFFAMEDVGGFEALGKGVESFVMAMPQYAGANVKQLHELSLEDKQKNPDKYAQAGAAVDEMKALPVVGSVFKWAEDLGKRFTEKYGNDEEIIAKADGLIARNKKYMQDAGLERPEQGGAAGVLYDIGQGGASLLASLGLTALTRNPATAGLFFGSMQNSSVYQEARTAGKTPEEATDISLPAGFLEGGLEYVGLDHFIKAMKGNSAVKRFITGFAIEATQEGSQQAAEELVTQGSGIRNKSAVDTAKDILYQAAIGGILGGGSNSLLGSDAEKDAIKRGIDQPTAKKIGEYVEKNVDKASQNMTEFIDRELAPIAKDEKSAQEFITLMQKFSNDTNVVDRETLDPSTRATFDQYVKMFNESVVDAEGVADVEKSFFKKAIDAGVEEDQAVAASKIVGARADAASRALGVSPSEWLKIKNISITTENKNQSIEQMLGDEIRFQGSKKTNANISKQGVKGSVTFGKDGSTLIQLFKGRDMSTLFHEVGHIFLRDMRDVSKVTKRPRVKADYDAVKKWLGAKGDALTVAQEEKFARGFEAYLREGKAPKPELQGVFDRFKQWLEQIYKSVKQLNVNLSTEIREVFDRMLGGDFAMKETLNQDAAERSIEADYEAVARMQPKGTLALDTGSIFRDVSNLSADAFVPVSTRLGKIDVGLKHAVRKFVFQTGLYTHEDRVKIKPFVEKVSNTFDEGDYRIFDLALKNKDSAKVDFLADKYGIQEEWKTIREVLDTLFVEAKDVGLDLNYIEDYFPRKVKRNMAGAYMAAMRRQENWSEIEQALLEADPNSTFTPEDQAAFVNSYLRGFTSSRINLARPSFTKERTVDYVTPEFNEFYQDSMPTLMEYVGALRHGIEARKLFGKSEKETDQNIGAYVLGLVKDGIVQHDQEQELKRLLKAVVEPTGTSGAVSWAKNASYVYLMGNPISAITQIQDLAFSLHENGYYRTVKSLAKSLTGNQVIKKQELGIDNILQEFEDETRASRLVRATFRAIGLEFMDNVGKEVYIDASHQRLVSAAKNDSADFNDMLETVFGKEAAQTKKDLLNGEMSENVKYLLFSELSDIQPISLAEMPVGYLRGGNGRVFYMLKTYTIRQLDIYRRQIFDNIFSGEPAKIGLGLKNLISLAASLMLMGMASDALKDLILGREIEIDDMITDNLLKLLGFTKYQIYKAKEEGIASATLRTLFMPPIFAIADDAGKDVAQIGFGKKKLEDAELLGHVPMVGKFYYWWWGGGKTKEDKKSKKKSKVSTP